MESKLSTVRAQDEPKKAREQAAQPLDISKNEHVAVSSDLLEGRESGYQNVKERTLDE